jgi:hypothetical protein
MRAHAPFDAGRSCSLALPYTDLLFGSTDCGAARSQGSDVLA